MKIEGKNVKLNDSNAVFEANSNGVISDATFAKYFEA